jgi:glycosyltransferase involved in cell wall biosynthesis
VVPNGFEPVNSHASPPTTGALEIVHAGEIYTGRSLVPVLKAAVALMARHPGRPIRVMTYGELPQAEWRRIREAGLEAHVQVLPRIPFVELFTKLQSAHVLLAIVGDHMLYSTPYKVYDYMAAGRPVLGLAPRGAALFEMLVESGAGTCVEPEDESGVELALERMLFAPGAAAPHTGHYHWSKLAEKYRAVLEAVAADRVVPRAAGMHPRDASLTPGANS